MSDQSRDLSSTVESLPEKARDVFDELLDEPLVSLEQLRREIDSYMELVEEKSYEYEFMDTVSAQLIAGDFIEVLEEAGDDLAEEDRRLLQAGIRYFVESDDAEDDFASPIGFDDDAEVKDAVIEALAGDRD